MNRVALLAVILAIVPVIVYSQTAAAASSNSQIPKIFIDGGFNFVNTDGNIRPKGASLEPGLVGSFRYYRKFNNEARIGFFGGLQEAIVLQNKALNKTYENVYSNRIVEYSPSLRGYVEIVPATNVRPAPRSYSCGGYDERTQKFYIYGGTNAPAQGESLTPANIFADTWVFDFPTRIWKQINTTGTSPKDRASAGCSYNGTAIFLFSGSTFNGLFTIGDFVPNDLYRLDLPGPGSSAKPNWVQLRAPGNTEIPPGRTQCAADRLPGATKIVFVGGDRFILPEFTRQTQDNIFTYDWATNTIKNLSTANSPKPVVTQPALVGVAPTIFLQTNGDEQGELTLADTCSNPNFVCTFPNTQVNRTFIYTINTERYRELIFDSEHEIPATRRSNLAAYVELENGSSELITYCWNNLASCRNGKINLLFNGGYGFNGGPTGTGELRNPYTFLWRNANRQNQCEMGY